MTSYKNQSWTRHPHHKPFAALQIGQKNITPKGAKPSIITNPPVRVNNFFKIFYRHSI